MYSTNVCWGLEPTSSHWGKCRGKLEWPVNLTCMSSDSWREWRTSKLHAEVMETSCRLCSSVCCVGFLMLSFYCFFSSLSFPPHGHKYQGLIVWAGIHKHRTSWIQSPQVEADWRLRIACYKTVDWTHISLLEIHVMFIMSVWVDYEFLEESSLTDVTLCSGNWMILTLV